MIETRMPDLGAVPLRTLLTAEEPVLFRALAWQGSQADRARSVAASEEGGGGGGAERID